MTEVAWSTEVDLRLIREKLWGIVKSFSLTFYVRIEKTWKTALERMPQRNRELNIVCGTVPWESNTDLVQKENHQLGVSLTNTPRQEKETADFITLCSQAETGT